MIRASLFAALTAASLVCFAGAAAAWNGPISNGTKINGIAAHAMQGQGAQAATGAAGVIMVGLELPPSAEI